MFTRAAGIIYGLWFFLAPSSYFAFMGVSPEVLDEFGLGQTQQIGLALFVVVWWIYRTATHITQENCAEFMISHAGGWGIFAVGGMCLTVTAFESIAQNPFFYQSVVFLILAVAFYAMRSPQGDTVTGWPKRRVGLCASIARANTQARITPISITAKKLDNFSH